MVCVVGRLEGKVQVVGGKCFQLYCLFYILLITSPIKKLFSDGVNRFLCVSSRLMGILSYILFSGKTKIQASNIKVFEAFDFTEIVQSTPQGLVQ